MPFNEYCSVTPSSRYCPALYEVLFSSLQSNSTSTLDAPVVFNATETRRVSLLFEILKEFQ